MYYFPPCPTKKRTGKKERKSGGGKRERENILKIFKNYIEIKENNRHLELQNKYG